MKVPYKYAKRTPLRVLSLILVLIVFPLVVFGMIILFLIKPFVKALNSYYLRKLRRSRNNRLYELLDSEYLKIKKDAE
jgi:ABC-type phosphate transport system permease subunit